MTFYDGPQLLSPEFKYHIVFVIHNSLNDTSTLCTTMTRVFNAKAVYEGFMEDSLPINAALFLREGITTYLEPSRIMNFPIQN